MTIAPNETQFDDARIRDIFGVGDIPDVPGFAPVLDDYTAGFASGVEAALEWLRSLPKIQMPTHEPDVVSIHDMSALEAAIYLEEKIEIVKSK